MTDSMLDVIAGHGAGTTKRALFEALRVAEVQRGLTFEHCLLTCGDRHYLLPSPRRENTVAVTPTGYEIFGESGRGWNVGGTAAR